MSAYSGLDRWYKWYHNSSGNYNNLNPPLVANSQPYWTAQLNSSFLMYFHNFFYISSFVFFQFFFFFFITNFHEKRFRSRYVMMAGLLSVSISTIMDGWAFKEIIYTSASKCQLEYDTLSGCSIDRTNKYSCIMITNCWFCFCRCYYLALKELFLWIFLTQ